MKKLLFFMLCLGLLSTSFAQFTKVETYQVGTQIDYYIGECGNNIPEAAGKLSFCDRAGNLAVVEESLGLNARGTLDLLPNYYNDSEVYLTRNGISIRHTNGTWENIPNVAFQNPILNSFNNNGSATGGVVLPDGKLLLAVNQAGFYVHTYDMLTKELTLSPSTETTGNGFLAIRNITYDPQTGKVYVFMVSGNQRYLYEYTGSGFTLLNNSDDLVFVFPSTGVVTTVVRDGVLYSGSPFGFFAIDLNDPGVITEYDSSDTGLLPYNRVNDFEIADDGTIWLAQQATDNNSGGVVRFDIVNETFEAYTRENPGSSVVDLLPQSIALNGDTVHVTVSNYNGVANIDFSTATSNWDIIPLDTFEQQGVPITYAPTEVNVVNGIIYYNTNDFSTGNSNNYEAVLIDGDTWTGRNDNAPGNISFRMLERFQQAHAKIDGGSVWINTSDDIIVEIEANNELVGDLNVISGSNQGAVDADDNFVGNLRFAGEGFRLKKRILPSAIDLRTEANAGTVLVSQYNDQIWSFDAGFKTIEVYLQDALITTYQLDQNLSYSNYFYTAVDKDGIFWALRNQSSRPFLVRYDPSADETTTLWLEADFGTPRKIVPAPDGGIWLLSTSDAVFYKDAIEYPFPNDLVGFGSMQDIVVDVNGEAHILTAGGTEGDIHTIVNPTDASPVITSIALVGNNGLLPTENTSGSQNLVLDTHGDYWINSLRGFYKLIDDDTTPAYRTEGTTRGLIKGRVYADINNNSAYDEGEEVAGQAIAINVNGEVFNTITTQDGIYQFLARDENTTHTVVLPSVGDDYFTLDRTREVAVTSLEQDYEDNDFILEIKDYNTLLFKTGSRLGLWGFDRDGFENTFTSAISNMSVTKTFNELTATYLFDNTNGGDLPEVLDVKFTKIDGSGVTLMHKYVTINPKNNRWRLQGISPASYTLEEIPISFVTEEETGKRRVIFTIPTIAPRDTWVIEIKTDLFDPVQTGDKVRLTFEKVTSPDFEDAPDDSGVPPGGDTYIMYPEEQRDFTVIPLPSEDLNSPYIDPSDPPQDGTFIDPSEVYAPLAYEGTIFSSYDPNDKLVDGGNTLEINETDIARKWLTYTIRFENTGNFSAKDVYILDELEDNIIPESFTLLENSHPVEVDFLPSGENLNKTLRFSFNDIFLPFDDENNDGWVKFRVRVKDNIAEGTIVENTAAIYFDQNPPIITNTIQNRFSTPADTQAPDMVCKDITIFLNSDGEAFIVPQDIDEDSTDNIGIVTLEASMTAFNCTHLGQNEVTLTGTDAAGNTASCTAIVTVQDEFPPQTQCAAPFTVFLDESGAASITVDQIDNGTTDNCGIDSLSIDITTFDCSDLGENTVTLSATDTAGFTSVCSTIVTVVDEIVPVAVCQDVTLSLNEQGVAELTVDQVDNGSTDNCGALLFDLSKFSFDCSDVGTQTVTFFVTDASGNQSTCEAQITVIDEITPNIVCQDITVQLDASGQASITAFDIDANDSTDNCGDLTYALSQDTFSCDDLGENTITFTVTDPSGNASSCEVVVTVEDAIAPDFDSSTLPQDQSVEADENDEYVMEDFTSGVVFTDNCDGVVIAQSPAAGEVLTPDLYIVTLTITDAGGSTATHTFNLDVLSTLSINDQSQMALTVYPNPVAEVLHIQSDQEITSVQLYDITGARVLEKEGSTRMDVSSLSAGIYIAQITSGTRTEIIKVIKK